MWLEWIVFTYILHVSCLWHVLVCISYCRVIQFYLKFGCGQTLLSKRPEPILLQFSTNGGILWSTFEQFDFPLNLSVKAKYVTLEVPIKMKFNSTRIQWIQPSLDGSYAGDWAIDQVGGLLSIDCGGWLSALEVLLVHYVHTVLYKLSFIKLIIIIIIISPGEWTTFYRLWSIGLSNISSFQWNLVDAYVCLQHKFQFH